jgi:hypothetical protein
LNLTKTLQLIPFAQRKIAFMQNTQSKTTNFTFKQQTGNKVDQRSSVSNFDAENLAPKPPSPLQKIASKTSSKSMRAGDNDDILFASALCP